MDRKKTNNFALIMIKVLSALSIGILVIILGYLIYRGLRYTNQKEISVLPIAMVDQDFEIYTNKKANLRELDWFTLQSMAKGRVRTLRTISSVNEKFHFYVDSRISDELTSYLAVPILEKNIITDSTDIDFKDDKGGMIVLPIGSKAPSGYIKVSVFDEVVAVNSDVTQLMNNVKIGSVTTEQIQSIQNGSISNWMELDGPNLKISYIGDANSISSIPGSVSVIKANDFVKMENVDFLKVVHLKKGWNISLDYLLTNAQESGAFGGIFSIILNTLVMIILVLLISTPIGIGAALYLSQYAKKGKLTAIIRAGIDLLSGIPSIIFGLFGMLVFVQLFGWGFSLISGCLTLSLMILPTIIRTSEESINTVDNQMIFASRGLGATKIETIFKIVLPAAKNGIVTGVILSIGRALGETAALVFTIGSSTDIVSSLTSSSRVLAQHIYLTIIEGQSIDRAFAAALQLIILELIINSIAKSMMNKGKK
jgi:phosphate transport system permease protein